MLSLPERMITSISEFDDATSFERFALAEAAPLMQRSVYSTTVDLDDLSTGSGQIAIQINESLSGAAVTAAVAVFRPLCVGAALKIIDVVLELGLSRAGFTENTFVAKARDCHQGSLPPLSNEGAIWPRLCETFRSLVEQRHCLVHRAFKVDSSGSLTAMHTKNGGTILDVTAEEQLALMSVAQRGAAAVVSGHLPSRYRNDLLYHLDRLARHHRQAPAQGEALRAVVLVRASATLGALGWTIDIDRLRRQARQRFPHQLLDLELRFPGAGISPMHGELESAAGGVLTIEPLTPPSWLRPTPTVAHP